MHLGKQVCDTSGMASPNAEASAGTDMPIDAMLQQYMFDIENCTTDLSQAPPALDDLPPFDASPHQAPMGYGAAMFPNAAQTASMFDIPDAALPDPLTEQTADAPISCPASKRSEAWTAKNRRAQKRFRERQKVSTGSSSLLCCGCLEMIQNTCTAFMVSCLQRQPSWLSREDMMVSSNLSGCPTDTVRPQVSCQDSGIEFKGVLVKVKSNCVQPKLICVQAQKGQMEQQLAEIAEKMRQLKTDNSKIASRNSTLERVLQFREGEIAELQEQNRVGD